MTTTIIMAVWISLIILPMYLSVEKNIHSSWMIWFVLSIFWILPIFTGINVKNNEGQYTGYVVSVEQNGAIFKGWNVYLKTELDSSDADMACIDRDNQELIQQLKSAQVEKTNITVLFEGVWQYKIGECPNSDWMVREIINPKEE